MKTSRDYLDQALASERGLKLPFDSDDHARAFLNAAYAERKRDRVRSRKAFKPGDKKYNSSPYDLLTFRRDGSIVLVLKSKDAAPKKVIEL